MYTFSTQAGLKAEYGEGTGIIMLDDVECTGSETSLLECTHRDFGESNCGHGEDASVVCAHAGNVECFWKVKMSTTMLFP